MRRLASCSNGLLLLLIVSLAFNAGFGTTFGVRTYREHCRCLGHGQGVCVQNLHEKLNLTPEQEAQMNAAREKLFEQVDELWRELTAEREALAEFLATAEPDRASISTRLDKITSLQQRLQWCAVNHLLEKKNLLTPEQRVTFNETIRSRVCPRGGHGPEGIPGGCRINGRPGWVSGSGHNENDGQ